MHAMVEDQIRQKFLLNEAVTAKIAELERAIRAGSVPPSVAADKIAAMVLRG
jgi:LAO/AO transport system kinase